MLSINTQVQNAEQSRETEFHVISSKTQTRNLLWNLIEQVFLPEFDMKS